MLRSVVIFVCLNDQAKYNIIEIINNYRNNNFVKAYFVFPARDRVAASNNFIGETAFSNIDMSGELLSKVRRTNTIVIESEGTGVVIARASE